MVLVDSSVWIHHLREAQPELIQLLLEGVVLMHPFVRGELACGNLKNRDVVLSDLNALPMARCVAGVEAMHLIEARKLWGRGLGWIDAHLLASALVSNCRFWTLDKRLEQAAHALAVNYRPALH
jgi:hypothetical protein